MNILNPYRFGGASSIQPETTTYVNRVLADGGEVIDETYVNSVYSKLKDLGILGNLIHWNSPKAGLKKNGSNAVSNLYSLNAPTDFSQATESRKAIWSSGYLTANGVTFYTMPTADYVNITINVLMNSVNTSNTVLFEKNGTQQYWMHKSAGGRFEFSAREAAQRVFTNVVVCDGTDHLISATFDGGVSSIYDNAVFNESKAATTANNTFPFHYLSRNGGTGYVGKVSAFSVFDIALTSGQLTEIQNLG